MKNLKDAIAECVRDYGYVTFVELQRKIEGTNGEQYIALPGHPNIWIWAGLSEDAADAIIELISEKTIFVHPATAITKQSYGGFLDIPEATGPKDYKTPHWWPCVLHHSAYQGED